LLDLNRFAPWCDVPKHVLHFLPLPVQVAGLRTLDSLCLQYRLPRHYFHLPNQFWAHKNHGVVIEALALLKRKGIELTVVCTGQTIDGRKPEYFDDLMVRCRDAGVSENFKVLGLVPYTDMQALMLHARAVINPSRFEGWSTTVEEAKIMGKQVLLSDLSVHREQAPAFAEYFAPDDCETLAMHLQQCLATNSPVCDPKQMELQYKKNLRDFGGQYMKIVKQLCAPDLSAQSGEVI
jgi:glycosyltransferase involved in cell wall biosynthesis